VLAEHFQQMLGSAVRMSNGVNDLRHVETRMTPAISL
jgi:hypothetical protein